MNEELLRSIDLSLKNLVLLKKAEVEFQTQTTINLISQEVKHGKAKHKASKKA